MNKNPYYKNNNEITVTSSITTVPFNNQPLNQSIVRETKRSSGSLPIVRSEIGFQYDFHCVGRYTSQILPSFFQISTPRSSVVPFNMECVKSNTCKTHEEIKEYILLEPVEQYKIHDTICKNCLSLLNYKRGSDYKARLFDAVIMENKEKIKQIRSDKIKIGSNTSEECHEVFKQTIMPCIDEFIYLSDLFEKEISGKIEGGNTRYEEIQQLKNFINSMELTQEGDPNVFGIGRNEGLKNKYIKLASFLIKYSRTTQDNISVSGITQSLKNHIVCLIALRKIIILRITDWLRYLIGGFYEEIHLFENLPLDENFRQNLQIDYVSEDELIKMRYFFENEIKMRDDHIKFLEEENERLRLQIQELNNSLCVMSENESQVNEMQSNFKQLENEWLNQKDIIESLHNEVKRKNEINSEYLSQIDNLRNELAICKYDSEINMKQALDKLRLDYEQRISELNKSLSTSTLNYNELEQKFSIEINQFEVDRENLNNQIMGYKNTYENDVNQLNSDIDNLTKELVSLKNTLNAKISEISQVIGERDSLRYNEDNLKNQINKMDNSIKTLISQISNLTQERDEYKNQINILTEENDGLKNKMEILKSQISGLESTIKNYSSNIGLLCDERDELKKQLIQITQERDNFAKNVESSNNKISYLESQVSNIFQQITLITNERDEARNSNSESNSTIQKMKNDIQHLTDINNNLESRFNELQNTYDDFTRSYGKLQSDYNSKMTIISNLEGKNNELDHSIQNLSEKINIYIIQIQKYEKDLEIFRSQNEELRVRLLVIPEKDSEITRLKQAISSCREEWNKLSESYEQLLLDIKNQITVNESLRGVIFELQGKIENHNQTVGGLDNAIRQQIEILTRQTLAKKNIEYNPNHEKVRESSSKMDILKTKIGRLESQKLNKSAVFTNVGFAIDENKQKGGITIQRSNLKNDKMEGSHVYQGVKQVVMQELPNQTTTTSYYQQGFNGNGSIYRTNSNYNTYDSKNINNNYSTYRPSGANNDRIQGSNVYNNYNSNVNKMSYNPSLMNNQNMNNSKSNTIQVNNLQEEDVKDKHGLFSSPVNVREEYDIQK